MSKKGFTLVELIVVIAIIAVLTAVVSPTAYNAIEKAKVARATLDMKTIKTAAMSFNGDTGTWPLRGIGTPLRGTGAGFINNTDGNGNTVHGWDGPYLEKWPRNPWGANNAYLNYYYWDADNSGDDNGDGIFPEAQVIMFNVPRPSALDLDKRFDNGVLYSTTGLAGFIYQNRVVNNDPAADPLTLNWMVTEPIQ